MASRWKISAISLRQVKKMGSLQSIIGHAAAASARSPNMQKAADKVDEKQINRVEAIINSMTPQERAHHEVINGSRRKRIARGSGTTRAGSEQSAAPVRANAEDVQADGQAQLRPQTGRDEDAGNVAAGAETGRRTSDAGLRLSQIPSLPLLFEVEVRSPTSKVRSMKWRSLEESTPGTDTRSLRDIYAERKELIARYVPSETQAVHARVNPRFESRPSAGKRPSRRLQSAIFRT